jgi:uncharacterized protein YijF (DUF1287 family)
MSPEAHAATNVLRAEAKRCKRAAQKAAHDRVQSGVAVQPTAIGIPVNDNHLSQRRVAELAAMRARFPCSTSYRESQDMLAERDIRAGDREEARVTAARAQIDARDAEKLARDTVSAMSADPASVHTVPEIGAALRAAAAATLFAESVARPACKTR